MLSGKVATALTGRHITIELFPFSFPESKIDHETSTIEDFIKSGGFPRALSIADPNVLLREYFTDIIERDVRRDLTLRSTTVLAQLVRMVFGTMGSEVSQRGLSSVLGVAPDTVGEYLTACENSYILLRCPFFSYSEKQRLVRNRKYYPIDLGLRASVITAGGSDRGKSLEALVYLYLRRRYRNVCYWRSEGEVDFVVQEGSEIIPYQVTWDQIQERHLSALREFKSEFPHSREPVLITRDSIENFLTE